MTRRRLLVVDDEPLVLRALARALGREHDVTTLSSPDEALARLSTTTWDLVLSDVMMPEMNGVEFARRAVELCPGLADRVVLMTGGAFTLRVCAEMDESGLQVMSKPIDLPALRALLAKIPCRSQR